MEKKKADALTYQMLPPTVAKVGRPPRFQPPANHIQDYQNNRDLMAEKFDSVTIYFW